MVTAMGPVDYALMPVFFVAGMLVRDMLPVLGEWWRQF